MRPFVPADSLDVLEEYIVHLGGLELGDTILIQDSDGTVIERTVTKINSPTQVTMPSGDAKMYVRSKDACYDPSSSPQRS